MDESEKRIEVLEKEMAELKANAGFQLKYPIDPESSKIVKEVIQDSILDIVWNEYYYYSTFFESIDGYALTTGGTGAYEITEFAVDIATDTTINSSALIQKYPVFQNVLRWDKESRFRTEVSVIADTHQEVRISIGDSSNSVQDSHYGFWIDNATLKGTTSLNTTVQTVTLLTVVTEVTYSLEARYYPGKRVDFYVDGVILGSLTDQSKLPSGESVQHFEPFFTFYIKNTAAEGKKASCSWFEYIQRR